MKSTICDLCGKKGIRLRRVTRTYGKGKNEFLIQRIPMLTCPHCCESYFTAETLREIERIKLHRRQLAVEQLVPVAQFEGVA